MINRLSIFFSRISSAALAIVSLILFMIFLFIIMPNLANKISVISSGLGSPDTLFFYDKEKLYQLASIYGEEGRLSYIQTRIKYDIAWPIVYALFLVTSVSWFNNKTFKNNQSIKHINVLPVFALIFDFVENISVSVVMYNYPQKEVLFSSISSYATPLKWLFVFVSFTVFLISTISFTWVKIQDRIKKRIPSKSR